MFQLVVDVAHARAVGIGVVGTAFFLWLVVMRFGVGKDVGFVTEAERTDDADGHFLHAQQYGHRAKATLECKVHQGGVKDVVLMVAEGNLRAAQFLCEIEDLLASVPRAEEAGRLLGALVEAGGENVKRHVKLSAEIFEIGGVGLIGDVLHPHVNGTELEARRIDVTPLRQQFQQAQRILSSRQGHKHMIAIVDQAIFAQGTSEKAEKVLFSQTDKW